MKKEDLTMIRVLWEAGEALQVPGFDDEALSYAVREDRMEVVQFLLESGVDVNDFELVNAAIKRNNPEMLELLIKHGACLEGDSLTAFLCYADDIYFRRPIDWVAYLAKSMRVFSILREHNADPRARPLVYEGASPFFLACESGMLHKAEALFSLGADVNEVNEEGNSVLYVAARNFRLDIVKFLHSKNANMEWTRRANQSILSLMARKCYYMMDDEEREMLILLMKLGVPVDIIEGSCLNFVAILLKNEMYEFLEWMFFNEAECGITPIRLKKLAIIGFGDEWEKAWNGLLENTKIVDIKVNVRSALKERENILSHWAAPGSGKPYFTGYYRYG